MIICFFLLRRGKNLPIHDCAKEDSEEHAEVASHVEEREEGCRGRGAGFDGYHDDEGTAYDDDDDDDDEGTSLLLDSNTFSSR